MAAAFIAAAVAEERDDEVKAIFTQMGELYAKKLWHNLTVLLRQLSERPRFQAAGSTALRNLYENFVTDFELRVNRLELSKFIVVAERTLTDPAAASAFLEAFLAKLKARDDPEAVSLCTSELSVLRLRQGDAEGALALAEQAKSLVDDMQGVDPQISALYYRAMAEYHRHEGQLSKFYRAALLMLLFRPAEDMPAEDRPTLAFDMGVAVLTAPDIVNFGELLAHPILESLKADAERSWLADVLAAVNGGDRERFRSITDANRKAFDAEPALASNADVINEKLSLLALVELCFAKGTDERTIPLPEVATACSVSTDDVELLLMRAMSLGLVKGSIDEVAGTVSVTWVQPRVLDPTQIKRLLTRLTTWKESVKQTVRFVEDAQQQTTTA